MGRLKICTHCGKNKISKRSKNMCRCKHVYIDLSLSSYMNPKSIKAGIEAMKNSIDRDLMEQHI